MLAAIAVIISAGQAYLSFQALRESRTEALAIQRIEACASLQASSLRLGRLIIDNKDVEPSTEAKEIAAALQDLREVEALATLLGPRDLESTIHAFVDANQARLEHPDDEGKVTHLRQMRQQLTNRCRSAIGAFRQT